LYRRINFRKEPAARAPQKGCDKSIQNLVEVQGPNSQDNELILIDKHLLTIFGQKLAEAHF
jgi:hypothetical protein